MAKTREALHTVARKELEFFFIHSMRLLSIREAPQMGTGGFSAGSDSAE